LRQESAKTFICTFMVYYYVLPLSIPRIVSLINPENACLIPESIDQIKVTVFPNEVKN
jgi:hypothetical protein